MKQIENKLIPFGRFKALTLGPFIFTKPGVKLLDIDVNHESIHWEQQKETLLIGFLLLYATTWLKELVHCAIDKERGQINNPAYKKRNYFSRVEHSMLHEREAYDKQNDLDYLKSRKHFAWLNYMFK